MRGISVVAGVHGIATPDEEVGKLLHDNRIEYLDRQFYTNCIIVKQP